MVFFWSLLPSTSSQSSTLSTHWGVSTSAVCGQLCTPVCAVVYLCVWSCTCVWGRVPVCVVVYMHVYSHVPVCALVCLCVCGRVPVCAVVYLCVLLLRTHVCVQSCTCVGSRVYMWRLSSPPARQGGWKPCGCQD